MDAKRERRKDKIITSKKEIKKLVLKVLEENPKDIIDYKAGIEGALDRLVGKVFKGSKGKADPALIRIIVKELLK